MSGPSRIYFILRPNSSLHHIDDLYFAQKKVNESRVIKVYELYHFIGLNMAAFF